MFQKSSCSAKYNEIALFCTVGQTGRLERSLAMTTRFSEMALIHISLFKPTVIQKPRASKEAKAEV